MANIKDDDALRPKLVVDDSVPPDEVRLVTDKETVRIVNIGRGDDRYTDDTRPDWTRKCVVCGQTPIMPATEMCGPCTTGEAETAGGNW